MDVILNDVPVVSEEVPRFDPLELEDRPRSLLLYLKIKRDSFAQSISSLGESFRPLLDTYHAILQQLERESDFLQARMKRLYTSFVTLLVRKRVLEKRIESLRDKISTMDQLIAACERKITFVSDKNASLKVDASKALAEQRCLNADLTSS